MGKVVENGLEREASCSEELIAMRDSLYVLGGKWKLIILRYLTNRTQESIHFKKLERGIVGISAKMLSKELRELEQILLFVDIIPLFVYYFLSSSIN